MKKIAVVLCILALTACAKWDVDVQNTNAGGVAGAVVGALAGGFAGAEFGGGLGQALFITASAMTGASVGYEAGTILYASDKAIYDTNAHKALNTSVNGTVSDWSNPETGNSGIFIPTKTFVASSGRLCRNYRSTLAMKSQGNLTGVVSHQKGTACQQVDGSWRSVSKNFG
jgi:surface antigen